MNLIRLTRVYLFSLSVLFFSLGLLIELRQLGVMNMTAQIKLTGLVSNMHLIFFLLGFLGLSVLYYIEKRETSILTSLNDQLQYESKQKLIAQEAFRESELRYRTIAEFSSDCAYWRDPNGVIKYISPACRELTGYPCEAFYQKPNLIDNIIHEDDREKWEKHLSASIHDSMVSRKIELRIITQQGDIRWVNHVYRSVFDESGSYSGCRGSHRDITETKFIEVERLQREKLQGVLEMAGAICHELNQPMMAISGYIDIMALKSGHDPLIHEKIDLIKKQIDRVIELSRKLMRISRYVTKTYTKDLRIIDIDEAIKTDHLE